MCPTRAMQTSNDVFLFCLLACSTVTNDVYYVCVSAWCVVATLCKYCLSICYENDCNEKRGRIWLRLIRAQPNTTKTRMEENFSFLYFVWWCDAAERERTRRARKQKTAKKSSNYHSVLEHRVSLNTKRTNVRSQISTISLIFFHCDHINCSHVRANYIHISLQPSQNAFASLPQPFFSLHPFSFSFTFCLLNWLDTAV